MRNQIILLSLLASLTASGCQQVECADGTIERDGRCEPAAGSTSTGSCGPFTELVGEQCVPMFPPTVCEDGTTEAIPDPDTGVVTCKGMGGMLPCGQPLICAAPATTGKQTICGQLYDFETGQRFEVAGSPGTRCDPTMPATSGPCALKIDAYDALAFGKAPTTTNPVPVGSTYIDECGRFKLVDIDLGMVASPYIGLGVDDAAGQGPSGVTVTAAVATNKIAPKGVTNNLEAFIVKGATATGWGTPPLSGGIYAPIFRKNRAGVGDQFEPQPGVTVTKGGNPVMNNDFYFTASQTTRTTIDTNANVTGMNGTALVTGASVDDSVVWAGQGGITDTVNCVWEPHAGASLPGIVFIQVMRKGNAFGKTCNE